jgi:hypothetical protein
MDRNILVGVKLTRKESNRLKAKAHFLGVSKSDVIRFYINSIYIPRRMDTDVRRTKQK